MRTNRHVTVQPVVVLLSAVLAGCGASENAADTQAGNAAAAQDSAGRVLEAPPPVSAQGPRVLVYHDMEGLSGQGDPNTFSARHAEAYARGRELLTADVNAVIAGLFDGGAAVVHVVDAHGSGSPEPDLLLDELDERAEMVFRDAPFRQYVDLVAPDAYDAIAVVGMHAKTGSGGFASHTYTLGMDILMNGMSITETELIGYSWGRADVPVIFASGDDRLEADLAGPMPWVRFVVVKRATSASTAEPRPVAEAHADLREQAKQALLARDEARVMRLTEPVRAALHAVAPATVAMLDGVPGVRVSGDTASFAATDFQAAYDGVIALIGVSRAGYQSVLAETIRSRPDGAQIMSAYSDALFARWLDYESGRWTPPTAQPVAARRYHGAN
ncbi:MAG: M55 family metallopeptidase [Longimicrobiales bacterium]